MDSCPRDPTAPQLDTDGEKFGDACDNAPLVPNVDQFDRDGDGLGDVIDDDLDGDGIHNANDNCPGVVNPTQVDTSGNGTGDACDADDDADGLPDMVDPCPKLPGVLDPSTIGCAGDEDLDGILDQLDNCAGVANANQDNQDNDQLGDACDPDIDGDGILNNLDNAPEASNPDQGDQDRDGVGDVIDPTQCIGAVPPNGASCLPLTGMLEVRSMATQTALVDAAVVLRVFVNRVAADPDAMVTWRQVDGPTQISFGDGKTASEPPVGAFIEWTNDVTVTAPQVGTYRLQVDVVDGIGGSASAELQLVVVDRC